MTDTRRQLDPGGYLSIVTDLLWSVRHGEVLNNPARLFDIAPRVVTTLRKGLNMLGKDPHASQALFDMLMGFHEPVLKLRRVRSAIDQGAVLDEIASATTGLLSTGRTRCRSSHFANVSRAMPYTCPPQLANRYSTPSLPTHASPARRQVSRTRKSTQSLRRNRASYALTRVAVAASAEDSFSRSPSVAMDAARVLLGRGIGSGTSASSSMNPAAACSCGPI